MFSTPGARILKFLISKGGGRGGWSGDGRGRMDGEQSNVYGFTKHPSCSHPPTAIPYFAVDIAAAYARVCVYVYLHGYCTARVSVDSCLCLYSRVSKRRPGICTRNSAEVVALSLAVTSSRGRDR